MGILDEAIREHLELKRQHGADESELKQLEDDAFGGAERPGDEPEAGSASEAPTEFLAQPDAEGSEGDVAGAAADATEKHVEAPSRRESAARIADLQEPPEHPPPAEAEEPSAEEHEAIAEPADQGAEEAPEPAGPSTEERHAIAAQPTEMYDVVEAGEAEAEPEVVEVEEEDEEFWSEQRLSDELDQALDAPLEPEAEQEPEPVAEAQPEAAFEQEEDVEEAAQSSHQEEDVEEAAQSSQQDEDVLEDTPDFLEESPEDDELWFEQKPPKDFDFDD